MNLAAKPDQTPFDRRSIPDGAREYFWHAADGHQIRRIDWPAPEGKPRGSILFMPGRGDMYEKYIETFEHWRRAGWAVSAADWRGQAHSGRLGFDPHTGHVDDFAIWVDDLEMLWSIWKQAAPGPHVLIGHSMGGHLVLRALAEKRVNPDAVVLSAPMLGMKPGWIPPRILHSVARIIAALGDARRPAWKWSEKPLQPPEGRHKLLTHDAERYADELWWRDARPGLSMGPASWGWLEAALHSILELQRPGTLEKIDTPVLVVATSSDALVDSKSIERAVWRLPNAEMVLFGKEARHEIFREEDAVRGKALSAVDAFLERSDTRGTGS